MRCSSEPALIKPRRYSPARLAGTAGVVIVAALVAGAPAAQTVAGPSARPVGHAARPQRPPAPSAAAPSEQAVAFLRGQPVAEPVPKRAAVAVAVDTTADAGPPVGVQHADIVIEPSTTRLLAVSHSSDPGVAGPLASVARSDAALVAGLARGVAAAMSPARATAALRQASVRVVEEGGQPAIRHDPQRSAPHNTFVILQQLWADVGGHDPDVPGWSLARAAPSGGWEANEVHIELPGRAPVTWTGDPSARAWLRTHGGQRQQTATGERLSADNVIVLADGERDGEATLLRDGHAFQGRWRQDSQGAPHRWRGALQLRPGRTWIQLLPAGAQLELRSPQAAAPPPHALDPRPPQAAAPPAHPRRYSDGTVNFLWSRHDRRARSHQREA